MGISMDASTKIVSITSPTTSVTVQELVNAIRDWEDEQENMAYAHVIDAIGKDDLGGGMTTGITMTLSSLWQVQFWNGVTRGTLKGGNVVGGVGGVPIKNTGGNDTILQLGAVATTIAEGDAEAIADAVWDEPLTGSTHNIPTSAGRRVREIGAYSIHSGTAQAGNSHSITLAENADANDCVYNRNLLVITDNTGVGQTRTIVDYDGTTKVAVIDRDWHIHPDDTTEYQITPDDTPLVVDHGVAQAGTETTITLRATASSVDDTYLCNIVTIIAGTGSGQARLVGSYDGGTNVITICGDNWTTPPDATSVYVMMPYGAACASCMGDYALTQINAEVVDATEDLADEIGGKWEITGNQMIMYKSDNVTEVRRFNLFDTDGNPATENVYSRERV